MTMKKIIIKSISIFYILTFTTMAQQDLGFDFSKAGSAGLQFLKIGVGAREIAMGGAVTGAADDANAIFWNVAGIAQSDKMQATFTYNKWLVDSKLAVASIILPFTEFVMGINIISFGINDFEATTVVNPEGNGQMVSAGDLLIGIGISRQFTDKLFIGGQIKYINEKLDDYSVDNILFDIGTLYYTGWHKLRLGFSLQHFGPDMKMVNQEFRAPLLFRVSATDEIELNEQINVLLAAELIHPTDNIEWVSLGTDINLLNYLMLRAGYRFNVDEGKLSFGVGVKTPELAGLQTKFDYAFLKAEKVFDNIHQFTLSVMF